LLDRIAKVARRLIHLPFGGLQVIFLGDFYQLPPVSRNAALEPETQQFCFESDRWSTTFPLYSCVQLATMFRQRDPVFIKVLQDARRGILTEETCNILKTRMLPPPENTMPTQLFPRNIDADKVNKAKYAEIKEPEIVYNMTKSFNLRIYVDNQKPIPSDILRRCEMLTEEEAQLQLDMYIENNNLEKNLALKKGALVMCLANLDVEAGICNGSQGVILNFKQTLHPISMQEIMCPVVQFHNGHVRTIEPKTYQHGDYPKFGCEQLPLRLAMKFLGSTGMNVLVKVMGLFTLAIGVQFMVTGISTVYKQLK
jgi:ATP-dependent DNA helicase PIF1